MDRRREVKGTRLGTAARAALLAGLLASSGCGAMSEHAAPEVGWLTDGSWVASSLVWWDNPDGTGGEGYETWSYSFRDDGTYLYCYTSDLYSPSRIEGVWSVEWQGDDILLHLSAEGSLCGMHPCELMLRAEEPDGSYRFWTVEREVRLNLSHSPTPSSC